ncbi:serine/threonine protein phosphatase [Fusarium oxysporum f. sp. phaseoli]
MAEPSDNAEQNRPKISACANDCLESFQKCLFSAASIHPRELSMVEDQLARFSSWANGIGVFAPGSASMDHRLRYAPDVTGVVIGLLESLNYRCQSLFKILISIIESSNQDNANQGFQKGLVDAASEISRLNKISNTIRRASKDTQALKASSFQIKDDEGNDVEDILREHFKHHICDKFPGLGEVLQDRLAQTMLLRRKRILYRRYRQGSTTIKSQKPEAEKPVELPNAQSAASSKHSKTQRNKPKDHNTRSRRALATPSQVKSATTLVPGNFQKAAANPSVVSASRTVALGSHEALIFPPSPGLALKKRYEQLKKQMNVTEHGASSLSEGLSEKERVGLIDITCPYCLHALPAQQVFDDREWQNHVINDLDAYICLFEDCDQPDVLYSHSDEWLSHLQQHRRFWRCASHRDLDPFRSSAEYIAHMRDVHNSKLNDNQLRIMANRNSRKIPKMFPSCPLCGQDEDEVNGCLEGHLAGHLRSLALKSLPSYEGEIPEDITSDNDSIDISRPQSRGTIRDMRQAEDALSMDMLCSGEFWELWNPDVPQDVGVNFMGDAHTELERATLFFDTYSYKGHTSSPESDPILQSMLSQKRTSLDFRERVTDELNKGDTQASGPRFHSFEVGTSLRVIHKSKVSQKGTQTQLNTIIDDGEVVSQHGGVLSERNGYLVVTIKYLQCSEPGKLICEARYGGNVSKFAFRAKQRVSDKTMILDVPYDIPKSFELSIFSETGKIGRGQTVTFLSVELDVPWIVSTNFLYGNVHKFYKRKYAGTNKLQIGEISFEISWQLTDPRASETQDHDHGELAELSETNHISPSSQVPRVSQALDDDQESSEDERGAGQRPTVKERTPIIGGPSRERVGRRSDRISARYSRPRSPSVETEDEEARKQRLSYQLPTQGIASRWPMPPPSASPLSTQRKEKPESDPLPRRKKGHTKRDKKEWESD